MIFWKSFHLHDYPLFYFSVNTFLFLKKKLTGTQKRFGYWLVSLFRTDPPTVSLHIMLTKINKVMLHL